MVRHTFRQTYHAGENVFTVNTTQFQVKVYTIILNAQQFQMKVSFS